MEPIMLTLKVLRGDDSTGGVSSGENETNLVYTSEYREGDRIVLESSAKECFLMLQVDDALGSALVYLKENHLFYTIRLAQSALPIRRRFFMETAT